MIRPGWISALPSSRRKSRPFWGVLGLGAAPYIWVMVDERTQVLSDAQWAELEPLIEACRPQGRTEPLDLRRSIEAIVWRHRNGAKWRSLPEDLGPWWRPAQLFIRWSKAGVWERLLVMAQERGVALGMTVLDGTSIRAHQKAAGAPKNGDAPLIGIREKRSAVREAVTARRRA